MPASCGRKDSEEEGFRQGIAVRLTTDGGGSPTWSPDGEVIVYTNLGGLWMIATEGDDPVRIGPTDLTLLHPNFLPHLGQRRLAFVALSPEDGYSIGGLNLGIQEPDETWLSYPEEISSITWLRSGRQVAFTTTSLNGVAIYDLETKKTSLLPREEGWPNPTTHVAASPTDDFIYFIEAGEVSRLFTIPSAGGLALEIAFIPPHYLGETLTYQSLAPSWDGTRLAITIGSRTGGPENWSLWGIPVIGSGMVQYTDPQSTSDCRNPSWSPDGTGLAFECLGQIWLLLGLEH
ncbi:TolB family protein [candidate division KSB1 bacterium]